MAKATILLVEDDPEIRELLQYSLSREGWDILCAEDGERGLELAESTDPDCLVLDLMLPGMDGFDVLRKLKAFWASRGSGRMPPVIVASAKGEDSDVIAGLELGALDYVVKPFSTKVLAARIRSLLRRSAEFENPDEALPILRSGELSLDASRHKVSVSDGDVGLTATEFSLLEFLMRNPGRVYSRSAIIDAVRGKDYPSTDRSVDVQMLSLRRKLGTAGRMLKTVRGVGYSFDAE
ncbi:MAG TPA: response regulator transcription factor [Rectinemataceae bacterium]